MRTFIPELEKSLPVYSEKELNKVIPKIDTSALSLKYTKKDALKFYAQATYKRDDWNISISHRTVKLVMIETVICTHDAVHAHVAQKTIAERLGLSVGTVNKAVAVLRKLGYLWVSHQYKNDAATGEVRQTTSRMTLKSFRDFVKKSSSAIRNTYKNIKKTYISGTANTKKNHPMLFDTTTGEIVPIKWDFRSFVLSNCGFYRNRIEL